MVPFVTKVLKCDCELSGLPNVHTSTVLVTALLSPSLLREDEEEKMRRDHSLIKKSERRIIFDIVNDAN